MTRNDGSFGVDQERKCKTELLNAGSDLFDLLRRVSARISRERIQGNDGAIFDLEFATLCRPSPVVVQFQGDKFFLPLRLFSTRTRQRVILNRFE